jgi:hypothetical protein
MSGAAWPVSSVVGDDPSIALGTLMPRAPAEYWLRHRDGTKRLATLSYLATDPERIAVAYGVLMPPPGAPERVALVYALARLLEAWQSGPPLPRVVHGDLSAKNVLWSLQPAPAVYVLDCDGATVRYGPDELGGELPDNADRRPRATTPNWDDPALAPGAPPTRASDRYMLGITFLRVVGAAHFPLQGPQRSAEHVNVDLELPRSWRKLPDLPVLWELCERSLSLADLDDRPSPGEWAAELEHVLEVLSAPALGAAVREAQGDPRPAEGPARHAGGGESKRLAGTVVAQTVVAGTVVAGTVVAVPDVTVRPVLRRRAPSTWQLIGSSGPPLGAGGEVVGGGRPAGGASWWAGPGTATGAPLTSRQMVRRTLAAWGGAHLLAVGWAGTPGRRALGLRRLAGALVVDVAAACVVFFIFAMLVSPWIGL